MEGTKQDQRPIQGFPEGWNQPEQKPGDLYRSWRSHMTTKVYASSESDHCAEAMLHGAVDIVDAARLIGSYTSPEMDKVIQTLGDTFIRRAAELEAVDPEVLRSVFMDGIAPTVQRRAVEEVPVVTKVFATPEELIMDSARICYRSEEFADGADRDQKLLRNLVKRGHGAMIEFAEFIVDIETDRGVTHELVRHRLASYAQESTRYVDYAKRRNGNIGFMMPKEATAQQAFLIRRHADAANVMYQELRTVGAAPQTARAILPTCTATKIRAKMNIRGWLHFLDMRDDVAAHPDMRVIAKRIRQELTRAFPKLFKIIEELEATNVS